MTDRVITYTLRGQVSDLTAKMAATSASVRKAAADMTALDATGTKTRANMSAVGATAGRMGLAVSLGVGLAAKAAVDWESAWAGVTKTVNGSVAEMAELEDGLRGLATTLPATHQEIAAVAEAAGQLGVAREDILTFTKTMVDLGETTNLTADEAATSIAQLANVMGTTGDEIDNLGSVLVALGNDGASTEREIIQMAQRIAGAGKTVGLTEGEVLAFANTVASMGIDVEAGGTAVSTAFAKMARAAASGGPRLDAFAATAGKTSAEFAQAFKDKPAEAMTLFIQGLERTQKAGGNLYAQLDAVGLADVRVSQALIGMASSGDLLTDSLALQAKEWERNKALTNEAEKRYDTTAAKTQVAWNNIKDAAIDAGAAMLPVISEVADVVTGVADAFTSLPGPVKSGITVMAGVGGVALLASVGVLKLSVALAEAHIQMAALSTTSPKLAGALGSIGKAAGVATVALGALRVAGELIDTDSTASVSKFTKAILDLSEGSKSLDGVLTNTKGLTSRVKGLSDLSATIKEADPSSLNKKFGSLFGVIKMNPYQDAMDDVKAYDQALTSLVSQGALDEAAVGQKAFAEAAKDAGKSTADVKDLLPGYYDALTDIDTGQRLAGDSAGTLTAATTQLTQAQEEAQAAARDQAESIVNIGDAAADTSGDLDKFRDQLIEQARALRDLRLNAEEAGKRGVSEGLIAELKEAGPEGAAILASLANASDSEIAKVNDAFVRGQVQIEKFTAELDSIPMDIKTKVSADTVDAMNKLHGVTQYLNGMNGRVVRVKVEGSQGGILKATGGAIGRAAGGSVTGPGTGTSDSIHATGPGGVPYRLSNGEHIVTAEEVDIMGGQAAMYAWRERLRAQRRAFATGGGVGSSPAAVAPMTVTTSLVGSRARLVGPDLFEFTEGVVQTVINGQDNYRGSRTRSGEK